VPEEKDRLPGRIECRERVRNLIAKIGIEIGVDAIVPTVKAGQILIANTAALWEAV
jgi:hypothetical protein